eukprot:scaffold31494_cov49-Prasinocladus_malaysianus.AAC.2
MGPGTLQATVGGAHPPAGHSIAMNANQVEQFPNHPRHDELLPLLHADNMNIDGFHAAKYVCK